MEERPSICQEFYSKSEDPWGFRTRWYEKRKREILVGSLPRERFASCWELGCSVGELTAALAARCDRVLATDGNARAVEEARKRVRDFPNVRVEHQIHPDDWPNEQFDLIVFSELGYNFAADVVEKFARRLRTSLTRDGTVVACHWRYTIEGCPVNGNEVHRIIAAAMPTDAIVRHTEADFLLEIWSLDPRSVAAREGMF